MTPLHLSHDDQRRLAAATEALLSPLAYPDTNAWRRAVCGRVRDLLGAAKVGFILPTPDGPDVFTEDFDAAIARYSDELEPVAASFDMFARLRTLGAADRRTLWGDHLDAYLRTPYWNEFLRPLGAYDSLTLSVAVGPASTLADHVQIGVNHDHPCCEPFGDRGIAIGRLLLPALQAGAMAWLRLGTARHALAALVDTLGVGALVFDADGRELHRNPPAVAFLASSAGDGLAPLAGQMARGLAGPLIADAASGAPPPAVVPAGRAVLRATRLGPDVAGREGAVLVTVEAAEAAPADPAAAEALRGRFGLTRQQARVALLLAARRSTAEIARALCISPHTVRRHVEQVLERLDVRSRLDVAEVIGGAQDDGVL